MISGASGRGSCGRFGTPAAGAGFGFASPEARAFAPHVQAAERFTAAARRYFEQAAGAPGPAAADAVRSFGDFLRNQSAELLRPFWSADDRRRCRERRSPQMPEWPALGLTREHQQRWQRMAQAARRIEDAQRRLQRLWSDALRDAAGRICRAACLGPARGSSSAEALHRLYDSWIDCAEAAYARTAHSEAFCDALADFVNAGSLWRREFTAAIEQWAKSLDLPTRSEINTLDPAAVEERSSSEVAARRRTRPNRRAAPAKRGAAAGTRRDEARASVYAALASAVAAPPAAREKDVVWQSGKLRLYRYRPIARRPAAACRCSSSMRWSIGRT